MSADRVFVIGRGEIGNRLGSALERAGTPVLYVTRHQGWDDALAARGALRILAMREDDLPEALDRFPREERGHLLLIQNGFLEAVLGPLEVETRALVWFTSKGDFFNVLQRSILYGRHADLLAEGLSNAGLPFEPVNVRLEFQREMVLKGIWNCVVGLPLAVHGMELGRYLQERRDEMEALVEEAALAASAEYHVEVPGWEALERLRATTGELGWVRGGARALRWRNGAIAGFGRKHRIPTPVNDRLLASAGFSR
jgi:ketopantoate reductase